MQNPAPHRSVVQAGASYPLGATPRLGGVQFSVYARGATGLELVLFDSADDPKPARTLRLDPDRNRTHDYWHAFVPGIEPGQLYGYRADGPCEPERGLRFDPEKVLIDPYARAVESSRYDRAAAARSGDNADRCLKSVVVDPGRYDWEGDRPLQRPFSRTVIYELHVRGFTRHPSSGLAEDRRGTFTGVIDRIPYLRELGINAVELMPVFHFDEQAGPPDRGNYWGYDPISFFAPHAGYGARKDPLGLVDEFRDMVKALHRAGIEVILDVVFNHTAEGGVGGPTLAYRGLANDAYYILEDDRSRYANYTGTGNTLNANFSVVRRMILDSLRYWVHHMHVDGFRFDLASILARDHEGRPLAEPPVVWSIDSDPVLAGAKLIAEAWDAAGLYQVGSFPGERWKEWNGRFRDDVRSFWRSDPGSAPGMATRLLGSPDVYEAANREPERSINFVTCHDGFTLNDLVSYDHKHNDANGEDNRDGSNDNRSWNCGVEGPSDDPQVEALRSRQVRNFMASTLLALGAPMLSMGDELRRTQGGNNNAYCQDNETSWLDWSGLERHADLRRFVRALIRLRLGLLTEDIEGLSLREVFAEAQIEWHGVRLREPDWSEDSHSIAFTATAVDEGRRFHVILNGYWEALRFELPPDPCGAGSRWRVAVDTAAAPPHDCEDPPTSGPSVQDWHLEVAPRSFVLLVSLA